MSATPDSTLVDPEQLIADLQRQLAASTAERDEALAQQTAMADMEACLSAHFVSRMLRAAATASCTVRMWSGSTVRLGLPGWILLILLILPGSGAPP
jgi:hypothetical protein